MNENQNRKHLTPLKAIRAKCLDCSNDQPKEVRLCTHKDCALYKYRLGNNPARKGIGNPNAFQEKNNISNKEDRYIA